MRHTFKGNFFFILSPQGWGHIRLSKHHYAQELARNNKVIFVQPPKHGNKVTFVRHEVSENLSLLEYTLPVPEWLRFRFPLLYKIILKFCLQKILRQNFSNVDYCIDFGCYQQFDSIRFFPSRYKIFFPVDNFQLLKPGKRGCDIVFTVSKNILDKFPAGNCHFINHGLSHEFAIKAMSTVNDNSWKRTSQIDVAYAGNLFLRFIDAEVLEGLVRNFKDVTFHFYGSTTFNAGIPWQARWNTFLNEASNVVLHGSVDTKTLVKEYDDVDIFLLCYKPDYKDYHAENSHKVLEYLSTGKVLVTTYLSIYEKSPLMVMSGKDKNEELLHLFKDVIDKLEDYNNPERMRQRKLFALDNTYAKQLERIADIYNQHTTVRNEA